MTKDTFLAVTFLSMLVNCAFLFWFVFTLNRIRVNLAELVQYSRRTALALPLTSGQVKLINRAFTPAELIKLVEKQGGKVTVAKQEHPAGFVATFDNLIITNGHVIDPEIVACIEALNDDVAKYVMLTQSTSS